MNMKEEILKWISRKGKKEKMSFMQPSEHENGSLNRVGSYQSRSAKQLDWIREVFFYTRTSK